MSMYVCLSVCLSACLTVCLPVCLSVCPSACLSVYVCFSLRRSKDEPALQGMFGYVTHAMSEPQGFLVLRSHQRLQRILKTSCFKPLQQSSGSLRASGTEGASLKLSGIRKAQYAMSQRAYVGCLFHCASRGKMHCGNTGEQVHCPQKSRTEIVMQ